MRALRIRAGYLFTLLFSGLYPFHPTSLHAAPAWEGNYLTFDQIRSLFQYTVHLPQVMMIDTGYCSGGRAHALVTFSNGMRACAKKPVYHSSSASIRNEFYSYQLAVLLGIHSVPPVVVERMPPNPDNWRVNTKLVFSLFVDSLQPAYIPRIIMDARYKAEPWNIENAPASERKRLEQWSAMIVLDYLTGEIDRLLRLFSVTSDLPDYSFGPVHNLGTDGSGNLVVYDNNMSFDIGGYVEEKDFNRVLKDDTEELQKFDLRSLCYFDPVLLSRLEQLDEEEDAVALLEEHARNDDPDSFQKVGPLPEKLNAVFKKRVKYVLNQAEKCGVLK